MTGILDEALDRLRGTGPERDGWLSNHAPMAVEALVRQGHDADVHHWIDGYRDRLEEAPRGIAPIGPDEWRDPLGDPVRTGDWLAFFDRELRDSPWRDVLALWWPRLLPGIAAGATHGVIRVGHAVRALLAEETGPRVAELGQGLGYWAARWQPLAAPGRGPYPISDPRSALDAVPRIADQRFGARARLAQLADLPGWPRAAGAVPGSGPIEDRLAAIVAAAVRKHITHGYGNPVMLVHAATAPAAVLRTLPALPAELHPPSLDAAWAAAAAVTAAYAPPTGDMPAPHAGDAAVATYNPPTGRTGASYAGDAASVVQRAVDSGDAHAIKFADAAVDAWERDADPALLAAADHATALIRGSA